MTVLKLNENNLKLSCSIIILLAIFSSFALEFKSGNREVTLETTRLRAVVRDGRIIHLENRKTGMIYADRKFNEKSITGGLGYMTGKEKELSKLHFPWGEPRLNQHVLVNGTDLYHYPNEKSVYTAKKNGQEVIVSWKGLTDGKQFFEKEKLSIHFEEDKSGALVFQGKGFSADKGVFAVQIPLENITQECTFLLPSFGGLEYPGKGTTGVMPFHSTTHFYEAPLMICSIGKDTISMWSEDARFRTFFAFFTRNGKSCSFALEFLNLIPYEQHNKSVSNPVKLDVFENSDWIAAARPYRDWYQRTFAKEIAVRDSGWANDIAVITDTETRDKKILEKISEMMPPERVLFHVWQARTAASAAGVPDYTPRAGYAKSVERYHSFGFKVMCYVCALCVTYGNDLWKRDKLEKLVLTRRTTITNYNGSKAAFDENLVGDIVKSQKGKSPFASLKPGRYFYSDPLAPGWRDYYYRVIRQFNELTGTDANYQDTLGCTDDVGNGVIQGLSGAEGNAELSRILQQRVGVPMGSEFGPAPIAFAAKWPLNYAQVWGNNSFRLSRIHRQRPLSPFLFGYRTWVPIIRAETDMQKHLISAVSDSLSGMGVFAISKDMQCKEGFDGHLNLRSQIFAQNGLSPYYPEKCYPENIRAMYKGKDGGIFQYFDDGKLEMMLSPEGKPLYGRVHGATEIERPDLIYPNWPIWDEKGIYSLDPKKHYALFPRGTAAPPKLRLKPLEKETVINTFYESNDFIYLEIGKINKSRKADTSVTVTVPEGFTQVICNDRYMPAASGENVFTGTLPLRLVFSNGKTTSPAQIRKINMQDGIQIGKPEVLGAPRKISGKAMYFINYFNAKSLDFIASVKSSDEALEVFLKNNQSKYGNGSSVELLVNGKREAFFNCCIPNPKWRRGSKEPRIIWDCQLRKWIIPVGKFAGKNILVSLRVSNKNSSNADEQWVSVPKIVTGQKQVFREEIIKNSLPKPKSVIQPRPTGKITSTLIPEWDQISVKSADGNIFVCTPAAPRGIVYGYGKFKIDRTRQYYLSGDLKTDDKAMVYIGVVQYDSRGRKIHGEHISPIKNTLTRLTLPAEKGTKKIKVEDAAKWREGCFVGFHAAEDLKDLPNRMLSSIVEDIRKGGSDWTVTLKNPLPFKVDSDVMVRQHRPTATHKYLFSGTANKNWKSFGAEIKWWPNADSFSFLIISTKPFEFKNLKLEIYQK